MTQRHSSGAGGRKNGTGNKSGKGNASGSYSSSQYRQSQSENGTKSGGGKSRKASGTGHSGGSNVIEYRRPLSINIGMIFFAVILIYVGYSVFRYATTKQVVAYEVRTGSLQTNSIYEGVALREEAVADSLYSGYINYYSAELERLAVGELAGTIDESGEVQSYLAQTSSEDSILTETNYQSIAEEISGFTEEFEESYFSTVYDFKSSLTGTIQKITNSSILSEIERIADSSSLHYLYTEATGYIVYNVDGYEGLTFEDLTLSDFDSANYAATELDNNALIAAGDPAYKIAMSEDWSVVIIVETEEEALDLQEESVIEVRFLKNQYEAWATIGDIREAEDGRWYVELTFTNSMMSFATDRFVRLELLMDNISGLKIPKSALIDDEFYVVPREYVTTGASGTQGVLRRVIDEDGVSSSEFIEITPYEKDEDEDNYYLDQSVLRDGDVLIRPDSSETLTLSENMLDTLTGVYNINEGYADFRQVTKLAENDEYAIVKSNSAYGLREYDYIVLDAETMSPDEFLYE